jgi:hypothetical protein
VGLQPVTEAKTKAARPPANRPERREGKRANVSTGVGSGEDTAWAKHAVLLEPEVRVKGFGDFVELFGKLFV